MPIVGLVLVIAWVVIVSVVPAVVRARASDAVPSLHQDAQGSPGWWARVLGFVGFVLAVAAPLAARAGLPPLEPLDRLAVQLVGIALVVVGIPAILGAQAAMGASWRGDVDPDARTDLVTGGPFAIVRNPVLSCMFIVSVGPGAHQPQRGLARDADRRRSLGPGPGAARRGAVPAPRPRRRVPCLCRADREVRTRGRAAARLSRPPGFPVLAGHMQGSPAAECLARGTSDPPRPGCGHVTHDVQARAASERRRLATPR